MLITRGLLGPSVTTSEHAQAGGGVSIRSVTRADLLDVFRIEQAVFPQPWPFSAFERYLDAPAFLVATDATAGEVGGPGGGDVVGYVVGDVIPNHGRSLGHVKDLAVRSDQQGDGVGSALLGRALRVLAAHGASTVKLEVRPSNQAALSLYARFGFEPLKTVPGYYADGEAAMVMVADLDAPGPT